MLTLRSASATKETKKIVNNKFQNNKRKHDYSGFLCKNKLKEINKNKTGELSKQHHMQFGARL